MLELGPHHVVDHHKLSFQLRGVVYFAVQAGQVVMLLSAQTDVWDLCADQVVEVLRLQSGHVVRFALQASAGLTGLAVCLEQILLTFARDHRAKEVSAHVEIIVGHSTWGFIQFGCSACVEIL